MELRCSGKRIYTQIRAEWMCVSVCVCVCVGVGVGVGVKERARSCAFKLVRMRESIIAKLLSMMPSN